LRNFCSPQHTDQKYWIVEYLAPLIDVASTKNSSSIGTGPLFSKGHSQWDSDFLLKKPFTLSGEVEFMNAKRLLMLVTERIAVGRLDKPSEPSVFRRPDHEIQSKLGA
jgi:hypothetical protein